MFLLPEAPWTGLDHSSGRSQHKEVWTLPPIPVCPTLHTQEVTTDPAPGLPPVPLSGIDTQGFRQAHSSFLGSFSHVEGGKSMGMKPACEFRWTDVFQPFSPQKH